MLPLVRQRERRCIRLPQRLHMLISEGYRRGMLLMAAGRRQARRQKKYSKERECV